VPHQSRIQIPASNSRAIIDLSLLLNREFPLLRDELTAVLSQSKHGITVAVEPLEYDHTREQENYYRKWCREFGNHCGMTPDEMHDEILCITFGSEEVPTKFGIRRRPLKRSRNAKISGYSAMIDTLIRVAAEMGFSIPPPVREI
jgi:hypothetical protein